MPVDILTKFTDMHLNRRKLIFLIGLILIAGSMTILLSSHGQNLQPELGMMKKSYRILEPGADYATVAKLYPNIEPIYPNVVPDIVHYLQFLHSDMSFFLYLSVKSVMKFHKPALIIIHCDCDNMTGPYWELLLQDDINIAINRMYLFTEIGGKKIRVDWLGQQNKDYQLPAVFIKFGGFSIDQDLFLFNSYQQFRQYNLSVKVDSPDVFSCNFIMAARNLTFHKLLLEVWNKDYRVDGWTYNCAVVASQIANKNPSMYPFDLRSKPEFSDSFECDEIGNILFRSTADLDVILKHYSVHLCNFFLKEYYKEELDKLNNLEAIWNCNQTFCKMARYILE